MPDQPTKILSATDTADHRYRRGDHLATRFKGQIFITRRWRTDANRLLTVQEMIIHFFCIPDDFIVIDEGAEEPYLFRRIRDEVLNSSQSPFGLATEGHYPQFKHMGMQGLVPDDAEGAAYGWLFHYAYCHEMRWPLNGLRLISVQPGTEPRNHRLVTLEWDSETGAQEIKVMVVLDNEHSWLLCWIQIGEEDQIRYQDGEFV